MTYKPKNPENTVVYSNDNFNFRLYIRRVDKIYVCVIDLKTKRRFNKVKYSTDEAKEFCDSLTPELFEEIFSQVRYRHHYLIG